MKVRVDHPYTIQCVMEDALRKERISDFFLDKPNFSLSFTAQPHPSPLFDILVIPVNYLPGLDTPLPVIVYGKSDDLHYAFLNKCDDFLKEPWSADELYWRIMKFLQKYRLEFAWGSVKILPGYACSEYGKIGLTHYEYKILVLLVRNRGDAVSRRALELVTGPGSQPGSRSLDMHISSLRKKLGTIVPEEVRQGLLKPVRGYGYVIP